MASVPSAASAADTSFEIDNSGIATNGAAEVKEHTKDKEKRSKEAIMLEKVLQNKGADIKLDNPYQRIMFQPVTRINILVQKLIADPSKIDQCESIIDKDSICSMGSPTGQKNDASVPFFD